MKKNFKNLRVTAIIIIINLLIGSSIFAQSPEAFKYQAIARNSSGNVIANQNVSFRVSILETSENGTTVYVETHNLTTNNFGLANLNIGEGSPVSGNFSTVDWAADKYFLKVEMDATGGTSYQPMGTSQLLSVPYALHAKTVETVTETDPVYSSSIASGITGTDTTNWNNKLDSYTETDPVYGSSVASGITGTDTTNWNNKLDSFTETDPIFGSSVASGITGTDTTNWNNKLDSYTETDPVYGLSIASGITGTDTTNWNNTYSWGDHSLAGYLTTESSDWKLSGNSGTSPAANFLGTTDAQPLVIKTNDIERMRITTKGQIETYNTGKSVFIGEGAGTNDDLSDNYNVFIGYQSGYSNTTGHNNVVNGYRALYSNTEGDYNTANGYRALYNNIEGNSNTANGSFALYSNIEGNSNTANGSFALYSNTTGKNNTANGSYALYSNTTGNYNTAIGNSAFYDANYSNSTAIGYNTVINADNQIRLGNSSVSSIGGQVAWSTLSDMRFKNDVKEDVPGLDFIMKLKPITYYLDMDAIAKFTNTPDSLRLKDAEALKGKMLQTGFIAQDVEKAASECGFEFSGVDAPKNENDYYGLRYAEFVVPLVKAVQEQQTTIDNQQLMINELKNENENTKKELQELRQLVIENQKSK